MKRLRPALACAAAAALVLAGSLTGCDPQPGDPDAGADAGPIDANLPPGMVEVGTGHPDFFAFDEGDTLDLCPGPQGAQHVWVAVRTWNLVPERMIVTLRLVRARDEEVVSLPFSIRVSLDPVAGEEYAQVSGLTLVVDDPAQVADEDLRIELEVADADGRGASTAKGMRVILREEITGCDGSR